MKTTSTTKSTTSLGSLDHLLQQDQAERRTMPLGITAAFLVHVLAFAMTWPSLAGPPPAPDTEQVFRRVPPISYVPPPPPPEAQPQLQPRVRRVQIPDPTPLEPEIMSEYQDPPPMEIPVGVIPIEGIPIPPESPPPPTEVIVGRDVDPPTIRSSVPPQFTKAALVARLQGNVVLRLTIDPQGDVIETEVLSPLGLGLTDAAIEATKQWKFEPCTVNGHPVTVIYDLTVKFRLAR
ncbi:MAG: energy transducer TonB [bacterium]|nr:energy transducer TonB [bacterium]